MLCGASKKYSVIFYKQRQPWAFMGTRDRVGTCCHRRLLFGVCFHEKLNGFNELINVETDGPRWKNTFLGFVLSFFLLAAFRVNMYLSNNEMKTLCALSMLASMCCKMIGDILKFL